MFGLGRKLRKIPHQNQKRLVEYIRFDSWGIRQRLQRHVRVNATMPTAVAQRRLSLI